MHSETREAAEEDAPKRSQLRTARTGQVRSGRRALGESLPGIEPQLRHRCRARAAHGGDTSVTTPHLLSAPSGTGPGALPPQRAVTPPCPCRGEAGATHIVPLDEFDAFLEGFRDADGLELQSVHPWLCPGHLHRMDALALPRRGEAAGSGRCRRDAGNPGERPAQASGAGREAAARAERLHWRWPKELARQRPGRAMRRHILYIPPARPLLTHTHARRARSRGAARSAPSLPSFLAAPPPAPPGSAPEVPPRPGQRRRRRGATSRPWPPPAPGQRPPPGSSGGHKDGGETLGVGDPAPFSAGSGTAPKRPARERG